MNRKIRVLIVDDSIVIRRLLADALAEDPEIEIAGTAANGKIALSKIEHVKPDVITLDIEMPEMDGLETLVELRRRYPQIPAVMFSTLTQQGAEATFDALAKGASDYVTKPTNVGSVTEAMQDVRHALAPKLKALCRWYDTRQHEPAPRRAKRTALGMTAADRSQAPPAQHRVSLPSRVDILAIGVSTGGPNALLEVLSKVPARFPVPIVIVQHMPPVFTKQLAFRLDQSCAISVHEAQAGDCLEPGGAWLAPGGRHMVVQRRGIEFVLQLNDQPPENSCRPSVDVLFRSVGVCFGKHVLATVLTGMGQDGLLGCQEIYRLGGRITAQDEATSVVWGMPRAVVKAGLADRVLPLHTITEDWINQTSRNQIRITMMGTGG